MLPGSKRLLVGPRFGGLGLVKPVLARRVLSKKKKKRCSSTAPLVDLKRRLMSIVGIKLKERSYFAWTLVQWRIYGRRGLDGAKRDDSRANPDCEALAGVSLLQAHFLVSARQQFGRLRHHGFWLQRQIMDACFVHSLRWHRTSSRCTVSPHGSWVSRNGNRQRTDSGASFKSAPRVPPHLSSFEDKTDVLTALRCGTWPWCPCRWPRHSFICGVCCYAWQ